MIPRKTPVTARVALLAFHPAAPLARDAMNGAARDPPTTEWRVNAAAVSDSTFTDTGRVTGPRTVASPREQSSAVRQAVLAGRSELGAKRIEDRAVAGESAKVDLAMNVAIHARDAWPDKMLLVDPVAGRDTEARPCHACAHARACRSRA